MRLILAATPYGAKKFAEELGLKPEEIQIIRGIQTLEGLRFRYTDILRAPGWSKREDAEEIEERILRTHVAMTTHREMDQTWDILAEALKKITYAREQHPSGRRFSLVRNDTSNHAILHIYSYNPDTFNPQEMRYTNHEFVVPVCTYNELSWVRWVFDCIMKMETHETTEWFMYEGKRIYAPHHGNGWDPYAFWPGHDISEKKKSPGDD